LLTEKIGNLTYLRSLYLQNNALKVLPDALGKLGKLEKLVLNNQLSSLSSEIVILRCLKELNYNSNESKSPAEIMKMLSPETQETVFSAQSSSYENILTVFSNTENTLQNLDGLVFSLGGSEEEEEYESSRERRMRKEQKPSLYNDADSNRS